MNFKTLSISCVIATLAAGTGLTSCSGDGQQQQQQVAPSLQVITVSQTGSELSKSYPALIKGQTDVDIRPLVTGNITAVHVDEGQRVHKGQTLFTLDQVSFRAAVDQAEASVAAARTAVANAQIQADNNRNLYDRNIISQNAWQVSDNQLRQAKAQLTQAEAALTTARKNLSYTVVTAPSDGIVGQIPFREGALASPSMQVPLTTISDNKNVYAYFSLTEKDLLEMTDNGTTSIDEALKNFPPVKLQLADGTVYPFDGRVATISGVIDNSTGSASVRALFPNPSGMLRSGSTGQVVIPVEAEGVIVIPQKATFEIQDLRYVFTLNDSNKTVTTPIQIMPINDGKNFVVTSGLKPGDRVVIEGIGTSVRPDMEINPVAPAEDQAQAPQGADK